MHTLGTTHHDVVGGVDAVAACAVSAEEVVVAIAVDEVRGLAVDGDVLLLVARCTETCLWVKLNEANGAEVCAVAHPKAACSRIEEDTWVDSVLIFHTIGIADLNGIRPLKVGRLRIEGLVPHGEDTTSVSTAQTTTRSTIYAEVTVANLDHVGSCATTWTLGATVPVPSVVGDDTTTACAECVPFTVTFGEG